MARFPEVYNDPRWEPARQAVIIRDKGLCQECRRKGIYKPCPTGKNGKKRKSGIQVHHIIELTEENKTDWNIAFNPNNLEVRCDDCHQHQHGRSIGLQSFTQPVGGSI